MFCISCLNLLFYFFFFFNDTATTEIYTLSLHDAFRSVAFGAWLNYVRFGKPFEFGHSYLVTRSEEHTSELQSHVNLVCRLLLEKKKNSKCRTYCLRISTAHSAV